MTTTTETVAAPQVKDFMPLHGIDHVELWVGNATQASFYFQRAFGFTEVAFSGLETASGTASRACSSRARSCSCLPARCTPTRRSRGTIAKHGDGVKVIALSVPDVDHAYREATARGATGIAEPRELSDDHGRVRVAESPLTARPSPLRRPLGLRGPVLPGFAAVSRDGAPPTDLLYGIDHIVGNVELGAMKSGSPTTRRSSG